MSAARLWAAVVGAVGVAAVGLAGSALAQSPRPNRGHDVPFLITDLASGRDAGLARPDVIDTPTLPGSIAKALTLVAALESGAIGRDSTRLCRRVVTIDGQRYVCSHPDLKRPLTPAEALAHSCNDFFLSLAPKLSRTAVNATRGSVGLPPIAADTPLAQALVGLAGPRTSPRALLAAMARLAGVGPQPAPMREATRQILRDGLRGAAEYGTAAALASRGLTALAKTGTAPMPGGGTMGLVVALVPAGSPTKGIVVVTPGAAGLDAAAVAADLLAGAPGIQASAHTVRLGRTQPDGTTRIETLALDDYVAQVVAAEGSPHARPAAQDALAITARTYALANPRRHAREQFDLCDTTHCQAVRPATTAAQRASSGTAGLILLHQGRPASVYHSAWCGGHQERASNVWPDATDLGGEVDARDDACAGEPAWQSDVRAADLERVFKQGGLRGDRLRDLRVVGRYASGRVARIAIEGFAPGEMRGEDFRTRVGRTLGWQLLKSTLFDVTRTSTGYRFTGRGFGHGVGLCVLGAGRRAERGAATEEILRAYFPTLTIGRIRGAPLLTSTTAPRDDIRLALPAADESTRAEVMALLRRARHEIATAARVEAPAVLRVTVHPTVESFTRASGQPWFSAGATRGGAIDLIPLALLRKDGQLERVARHEVAHALLDAALSRRPLWVREGAARHFAARGAALATTRVGALAERRAGAGRSGGSGARPVGEWPSTEARCPTDAELRQPTSPDAQREAHARAEACFTRALAQAASWREVQ